VTEPHIDRSSMGGSGVQVYACTAHSAMGNKPGGLKPGAQRRVSRCCPARPSRPAAYAALFSGGGTVEHEAGVSIGLP